MNQPTADQTLREGFTSGTCAAAAALAAGLLLFRNESAEEVELTLPMGKRVRLPVEYVRRTAQGAQAGVRKDAGDDPDITHRALIVAEVLPLPGAGAEERAQSSTPPRDISDNPAGAVTDPLSGFVFAAGEGVGTITRPGLQLPPGEAAINPVPRRQIAEALRTLTGLPVQVTIGVPGGAELARKTFNPKLGIEGGLSIIGTSGIVRPFSHEALRDSVLCALQVAIATQPSASESPLFLVPGHYGEKAARALLHAPAERIVEVSNEWDIALPTLKGMNVQQIWLAGHPGKLAKLPAGFLNTHSRCSPSPLPLVRELAAQCGISVCYEGDTVEGLFAALPADKSGILAKRLAWEIAAAAGRVAGLPCRVLLINMQGQELGRN